MRTRPGSGIRRVLLTLVVLVALVVAGVAVWPQIQKLGRTPGCTVSAPDTSGLTVTFPLSGEQADNAATIAGVGSKLGMPDHAVTIALATSLQESQLLNLTTGDRDSVGLFQQRPSQGWGTRTEILDPVYASTAFYQRLETHAGWQDMDIADAAQLVQRSGAPDAYAQWETRARAIARALTGEAPGSLTCVGLTLRTPGDDLVSTALSELGTTVLSGPHPPAQGWRISSWLVAHAARFGIDQVTFDGRTWTMDSGAWVASGPPDGSLSLHRATTASAQ